MRTRLYQIIERSKENDRASAAYDFFIALVAILSVTKLLSDVSNLPVFAVDIINDMDNTTVAILFLDYILRWITYDIKCAERGTKLPNGKPLGKLAFFFYPFTLMAIIDLIGLLPSLFPLPSACRYLMLFRLTKVFRMLPGFAIIRRVFIREGRTLLSIFGATLLYVVCVALIMYSYEPDTFNDFIDAIYWSTTALATIGYGDLHPTTQMGKLFNIFSALVGIAVVALPSGIITGGYVTEMRKQKQADSRIHQVLFTDYSVSESILELTKKTGRGIKERRVSRFIAEHPRSMRNVIVMTTCIVLNFVLFILWYFQIIPLSGDFLATTIAAFLLEPTAGVFVGFFGILEFAITFDNLTHILYFVSEVLTAMVFGAVLSIKKDKLNVKRDVAILIATTIVVSLISTIIWTLDGGVLAYSNPYVEELIQGASTVEKFGISLVICLAGYAICLATCYIVAILLRPLRTRLRKRDEEYKELEEKRRARKEEERLASEAEKEQQRACAEEEQPVSQMEEDRPVSPMEEYARMEEERLTSDEGFLDSRDNQSACETNK